MSSIATPTCNSKLRKGEKILLKAFQTVTGAMHAWSCSQALSVALALYPLAAINSTILPIGFVVTIATTLTAKIQHPFYHSNILLQQTLHLNPPEAMI